MKLKSTLVNYGITRDARNYSNNKGVFVIRPILILVIYPRTLLFVRISQ